jgi:hypothetical protein
MAGAPLRSPHGEAPDLSVRAMDNLRFIRETMEQAGAFTAVPGWGGVTMGVTALVAAALAAIQPSQGLWLRVWLAEAVFGAAIGGFAMWRKASRVKTSLLSAPARKFLLAYLPPIVVGAVLTAALDHTDAAALLPSVWLLCYGAAAITGGALSVPVVPLMGMGFVIVGILSVLAPTSWSDALLALGFGGLHIVFGFVIARRHGG